MGMRAKKSITVQLLIFFMIIWGVISILLMSVFILDSTFNDRNNFGGTEGKGQLLHSNCERRFESNY